MFQTRTTRKNTSISLKKTKTMEWKRKSTIQNMRTVTMMKSTRRKTDKTGSQKSTPAPQILADRASAFLMALSIVVDVHKARRRRREGVSKLPTPATPILLPAPKCAPQRRVLLVAPADQDFNSSLVLGASVGTSMNAGGHIERILTEDRHFSLRPAICQQDCSNSPGSFKCICREGFTQDPEVS